MTLARGARQLVVQEALLRSQSGSFSHPGVCSEESVPFRWVYRPLGSLPDNGKGLVVLLMVDTHDEHGGISTGCRDDHSLGTTLQVSLWGNRVSTLADGTWEQSGCGAEYVRRPSRWW